MPVSLIKGGMELIILFNTNVGDVNLTLTSDSLSEEVVELVPVSLSYGDVDLIIIFNTNEGGALI